MDPLFSLVNQLLSIAIEAFMFFVDLILAILEFFVVFFQAILNVFHAGGA